ncbi:MAG: hydroxymethylbilane synthase, partial [Saprospiraceae bacterium]
TGLTIAGVSIRQDPADWLLIDPKYVDKDQILQLPLNANVGTSSVRRKSQLLDIRPDLQVNDLRGNVPTRIQKLRQGDYQAIVLAAAGIQRLNLDLSDLIVFPLHPREFVPAPAQGVMAYQCKKDNKEIREIVKAIHQTETARLTNIERKVLQMMDGGCQVPIGVYCETDHFGHYHVWAAYSANENEPLHRIRHSSSTSFELAETIVRLLKSGQSA